MVLQTANDDAKAKGKNAFITIPGIGNGAFADEFRGSTIGLLNDSLKELLEENPQWNNIGCIWLDGFRSDICNDTQVGNAKLRVRNTGAAENEEHKLHDGKPFTDLGQMSKAQDFAESAAEAVEFADCERFKIFAWDHFSYEGNDWVGGSRMTDEANMAACNGLGVMGGVPGEYRNENPEVDKPPQAYYPPEGYSTWSAFFTQNNIKQSIADRLFVQEHGVIFQLDPDSELNQLHSQLSSEVGSQQEPQNLQTQLTKEVINTAFYVSNTRHSSLDNVIKSILPKSITSSEAVELKKNIQEVELNVIKKISESAIPNKDSLIDRITQGFAEIYLRAEKLINSSFLNINSTYKYGANNENRLHANSVSSDGLNERYNDKAGDVLKRAILEDIKEQIADCDSASELSQLMNNFKQTKEYKTLETPQGLYSSLTGKKTSSIEALELMVTDAKREIKKLDQNPIKQDTGPLTIATKKKLGTILENQKPASEELTVTNNRTFH